MRKRRNGFTKLQAKIEGRPEVPDRDLHKFKEGDRVKVMSIERSTRVFGRPSVMVGEVRVAQAVFDDRIYLGFCAWVLPEECCYA